MDKTLQIVIVAAVLLMAAAIIGSLVTNEATGIGNWGDNTTNRANCDLLMTEYENKGCDDAELEQKINEKCDASPPTC